MPAEPILAQIRHRFRPNLGDPAPRISGPFFRHPTIEPERPPEVAPPKCAEAEPFDVAFTSRPSSSLDGTLCVARGCEHNAAAALARAKRGWARVERVGGAAAGDAAPRAELHVEPLDLLRHCVDLSFSVRRGSMCKAARASSRAQ